MKTFITILFTVTACADIFLLAVLIKSIISSSKYYESKKEIVIDIIKLLPYMLLIMLPVMDVLFIYDFYFSKDEDEIKRRKKMYEMTVIEKYDILVETLIDCGYFKNHREVIDFIEGGKIMDALVKDYSQK